MNQREKNRLRLDEQINKKKVLIAAHRGTCGGNIIQNTIGSYENALRHKADIIEIDVSMSTDGDFFAFHDGTENTALGIRRNIRTMTTSEIKAHTLLNSLGVHTHERINSLGDVLAYLKGRCLINIDRSWFYWPKLLPYLNELNMGGQLMLKSPPSGELLKYVEESAPDLMYMPICRSKEEVEFVMKHNINIVAVEVIFNTMDSPLLDKAYVEKLHKQGLYLWANAITLDDDTMLSAQRDDNGAIKGEPKDNWGWIADKGFDMIQTDWPMLLKEFLVNN